MNKHRQIVQEYILRQNDENLYVYNNHEMLDTLVDKETYWYIMFVCTDTHKYMCK